MTPHYSRGLQVDKEVSMLTPSAKKMYGELRMAGHTHESALERLDSRGVLENNFLKRLGL